MGNYIGTDVSGTSAIANYYAGVIFRSTNNNTVGGTAAGQANLIANNTLAGVYVSISSGAATGNRISGNRIFNNGGLGIDLGEDGVPARSAALWPCAR